jgi:hypothetical protein
MVMAVVVVAENKVVVEVVVEVLAKQGADRGVDGVDVRGGAVGLGVALDVVDSMVE